MRCGKSIETFLYFVQTTIQFEKKKNLVRELIHLYIYIYIKSCATGLFVKKIQNKYRNYTGTNLGNDKLNTDRVFQGLWTDW